MDRTKLFTVGTALIALTVLFAFSQGFINPSGFFGLSAEETQLEEGRSGEEGRSKVAEGEAENTTGQETISAGLSFEVLKPTSLEASLVEETILPNCPEETEVEILVKNTGDSIAEKMYFSFETGIRVIGCNNCELDELFPNQEIKANARLCLESTSINALTVGSANSNKIELNLE